MKFLVVSHHLPPRYSAGAELYSLQQCQWLQSRDHIVRAVAVEDIEADVPALQVSQEIYQGIPVSRLYFNRLNYPNPLEASHNNPEIEAWFDDYLAEYRPDIMLVNACYLLGVGILEAARRRNVPVAVTLHDFWFLCQRITLLRPDGQLCDGRVSPADCALCLNKDRRSWHWADKLTAGGFGRAVVAGADSGLPPFTALLGGTRKLQTLELRRARLLAALNHVDLVIAPSQYLKQVFVENGFPSQKIHYCRYGLATARLRELQQQAPASARQQDRNADGLRFGFLGQIRPHKGVDVLVRAFRILKSESSTLKIYGATGADKAYDRRLQQLAGGDGRISFAGPYAGANLPQILSGLDVVVVPSVWHENSPLVIMEAHTAGRPVITTRLGGMTEMVRHETDGLLFERGDYTGLSQQLQRLVDDPELLARLRRGIGPVKSLDQEYDELLPLYEQAILRPRQTYTTLV